MPIKRMKRSRPGGADDAAAGSGASSARRRPSLLGEVFRELFVPVGPQQAYPPVFSSYIERVSVHNSERKDSINDEDDFERIRPKSDEEVRREKSWLERRKERRPSLTLPPAEAPVFTQMIPPQRKKVDLDSGIYVSPSLAGMAGDALPALVRAIKQDERRKRAERVLAEGEDEQDPCCQKLNPFRRPRTYLFVLTCVYVFWYAGAFFGYGPMQLMLERQGAFAYLCDDADLPPEETDGETTTSTTTCPEQNAMLLNVQFVAQLTMIASPLLGAWCDKNGPAEVAGGLFVSGALGILLLAIATSKLSVDWLLFPSFLCSGLMAQIAGLMTVQTGLIFEDPRKRNRAISALNALYDAGAITYLILWYIDTHTALSLPTISALNLALFVFVVGSAIKCWFLITDTKGEFVEDESRKLSSQDNREEWDDEECKEEINDDITHTGHTKQTHLGTDFPGVDDDVFAMNESKDNTSRPREPGPRQPRISWRDQLSDSSDDQDGESESKPQVEHKSALDTAKASVSDLDGDDKGGSSDRKNGTPLQRTSITGRRSSAGSIASMILRRLSLTGNKDKPAPVSKKTSMTFGQYDDGNEDFIEESAPTPLKSRKYVLIASRPALDQLRSSQFLTLAAFFAFHHSRNTWTLTTTRDFLAYLGDDETGNKYLAIFTLLTPASVLGLPFVDKIVHKFGYAAGLHVVNALAIGQGIIQVSSDNLNVQVIGFVLYSFYRCFLFSVCFSALPAFLDGIVLGKGYGLLIFSGGVLSLMNIPLSNAAVQKLGGNFFIPNLIYTVLCGPCIVLVWMIHRGFMREADEKRRLKEVGSSKIARESIDDDIDDSDGDNGPDDNDADGSVAEVIKA